MGLTPEAQSQGVKTVRLSPLVVECYDFDAKPQDQHGQVLDECLSTLIGLRLNSFLRYLSIRKVFQEKEHQSQPRKNARDTLFKAEAAPNVLS